MQLDLRSVLTHYGASQDAVKLLDSPNDPSLLRYVDLFPENAARKALRNAPMPAGVVEIDDRPLLYLYRADALAGAPADQAATVAEIVRELACRGEGSYLAVVHPGELVVYPVALMAKVPTPARVQADQPRAPLFIAELASGEAPAVLRQQAADAKSLHDLLFKLITSVAVELRKSKVLSIRKDRDEVLPLVGRAVFARFLVDRGIINHETFPELYAAGKQPELAFSTPELAARTCAWLDHNFNGELLPLLFGIQHPEYQDYLKFFSRRSLVVGGVLHELTNVMYRAPNGRLSLALSWDGVDFAHVPIGLLSEVYEDYAHRFYKDDAQRESVRYTPRHIAAFTVAQAFEGLPQAERAAARVLDPAAGAGIFLVLTLQHLVAENWRATGKRPDTTAIRRILDEQIRGYDINYSAMTLAALSLYLAALELDPDPFPPEKLKFRPLIGKDKVLRNMRSANEQFPYKKLVLGSLGPEGDPPADEPKWSIITGNPPWTSFRAWGDKHYNFNHYVQDMVRRIMGKARAGNEELKKVAAGYEHNDLLPDTAFMWRAMEWAKDDGVIAFIVAARVLYKRGDIGARVREALFRSMRVTGVLNGSLLMPLWPQLNQPFCILFARNRAPKPTDRFTFVTPVLDSGPAGEPRMRIDSEARQPVELKAALERPHLFKVLTRGGRLDLDIVERIQGLSRPEGGSGDADPKQFALVGSDDGQGTLPVGDYWAKWTGGEKRYGQGYIEVGKKTRKQTKKTRQRVAELLRRDSLTLTSDDLVDSAGGLRIGFKIQPRQLDRFKSLKLYRLADPGVFNPPLVLVNEGFGESPQAIRARLYLGQRPLVFRRNFYGFSCANHPRGAQLAKYLFCVINSDLFGYYTLQASAKFGVERRTLLMEDIEEFPILQDLSDRQWDAIATAADELTLDKPATWQAMNRCINKLYGLTAADEQVIRDTLATMMPYKKPEERATAAAKPAELERFRLVVESMLKPLFEPDGQRVTVTPHGLPVSGWVAFDVTTGRPDRTGAGNEAVTRLATALAAEEGASRLIQRITEGHVRVVIRNQYRYLTPSRARLCAIDVMREHGSAFPMKGAA